MPKRHVGNDEKRIYLFNQSLVQSHDEYHFYYGAAKAATIFPKPKG
ncbi:hypothetical protein [Thalassobacillus devorans]|nr:hypothetical protein [Thalassobacillus devorans]